MEKRSMDNFLRACVVLVAFAVAAISANAQSLTNPSFETPGTNFIFAPDAENNIITNTQAANWILLNLAFRTGTNSPASGIYWDPSDSYEYLGVNNSGSTLTAHTGGFSSRAIGPFTNLCCGASGIYQEITNSTSQAVSNGQIWAVSGYGLNWSGDPMQDVGPSRVGFGTLQVGFLVVQGGNTNLITTDSAHLDTNTVFDTWTSCTVTATAPPGTIAVRAYALHVGMNGAFGSIFWDDLTLAYVGLAPPPPPIETNQFQAVIQTGNQICWPTVGFASYQPQYSDDNSTWINIGAQMPGDGTTNCVFAISHKFYRVLKLQ